MKAHITAVAVIRIGLAIIEILLGLGLFFLFSGISLIAEEQIARSVLSGIGLGGVILTSAHAIPGIIGSIGLLKYKNWARFLILIISAIDLINIPIGTALGVYSIWVLVQKDTEDLFKAH